MYYLAIIQNDSVATLYSYETYEAALAAFHSELAYRGEGRTSTKCAILNADLQLQRQETYVAPVSGNTESNED